jgi:DNA repair exonuclease SbcCD ATPase subunit
MAVHSLDAQKNTLKALETDLTATYGQQLDALVQRADTALGAAEETIDNLESRASQLTNDFIDAVHQLRDAIDHSRTAADGVVQTAAALLTETKGHVDELNKKREADLAELQQMLAQLEQQYQQIESEASAAFTGVVQHANPLVALVAQGASQVHDHGEQLSQSLQAVEHAFADDVKNMASALHDLAQHIQTEQEQHDHAQDQHATGTHAQTQQLIAGNLATLTQGMQGVGNAFSVLTEYGDHLGGSFGDGAKGLIDTVGEISHIVDAIKPVLDVIKAIE